MPGDEAMPKLVLLDRDGVINYDSEQYIKSPDEWRPVPGSIDAIRRLHEAGFQVVVVSNQSGVGRGLYSEDDLAAIHARMTAGIAAGGGELAGIYYCPHHPDDGCGCRKPRTGLLDRIARDFNVSLAGVAMIGDKESDCVAAARVGARPILVGSARGDRVLPPSRDLPYESYPDLASAVDALLAE